MIKGMGGAMDLVAGAKRVIVTMDHVTRRGGLKLLRACTLPLTGRGCVDLLITDLGVFTFEGGLQLIEIAPGVTVDEIREKTEASFSVAEELAVMA